MYGEHFQPTLLHYNELRREYSDIKNWKVVRNSRKGNRIMSGDNFESNTYETDTVYISYAYITYVWAVVSPDDQVLYYIVHTDEYSW